MRKLSYNETVSGLDLSGISDRTRAALLRGVRGGDGSTENPLDALMEQVSGADALDDAELGTLVEGLREGLLGLLEDPTDDNLATAEKVDKAIESLSKITEKREADAAARQEKAEALRAKHTPEADAAADDAEGEEGEGDGEAEGEGDDAEGEDDADAEGEDDADAEGEEGEADASADTETPEPAKKVSAARTRSRMENYVPDALKPRQRQTKQKHPALKLTASANLPGVNAGEHLDTPQKIAAAFGQAVGLMRGYRGGYQQVNVCSLGVFDAAEVYGEERTLRRDVEENERRMAKVTSPAAIKAAGGICAPAPIDYTQPVLGTTERPVWNGMVARFGADRGGVKTLPVPTLADVEDGIDVWTEENDQDPSDPATKPCVVMTCPEEDTTLVEALTKCLKVGEFRRRYWAEQVEAWVMKAGVQAARFAESRHLTQIGAGSTNVTVDQVLGTTRDILAGLDRAHAGMTNFFRFDPGMTLTFGGPAWLLRNMVVDLSREQPGSADDRLKVSEAEINGFFAARAINPNWFLDGEAGQIFGAQTAGLLNKWPANVVTYLYPTGVWKGLDGGSLDFGIVRDEALIRTNDLMMFSETFEAVHFHGDGQSLRMQFEICANGQTSAATDIDVCNSGS